MITWVVFGLLLACVVMILVWPMLRQYRESNAEDVGLTVYRDQLHELERDEEAGRLGVNEVAAARIEIQRRMLAAADAQTAAGAARTPLIGTTARLVVGLVLAFAVPGATVLTYQQLGSPGAPDLPLADRAVERARVADSEGESQRGMREMAIQLEKRLKADPNDLDGWALLGRTYLVSGDYAKAAEALRRAVGLSQGNPEIMATYGEALVMLGEGTVSPEAESAFVGTLERMPGEPRARYYLGLARQQRGEVQEALKIWLELEADTPEGAGWSAILHQRIEKAASDNGLDLEVLRRDARARSRPGLPIQEQQTAAVQPPSAAPGSTTAPGSAATSGPTTEDLRAAKDMSAEDRQAMIQSMVARLAGRLEENPDDLDGWLRLARAYRVLGRGSDEVKALGKAAEVAPGRADIQLQYARALFPPGTDETAISEDFKRLIVKVRDLDPENVEGMFFAGMIAASSGDKIAARSLWQGVLKRLGPDAPAREMLEKRLQALGG
ncbi:MAG: c-type cytochrome biogenesis protein CcmI [Rhodospirillaceae bacterium]|jgi:cytochrome c-type biogenesis protein CcmH|nr:c-type cytochrome biogenesis protein CcmI [Rhodospirillaceae bacterium]MBT6136602.1 c-type cytochrome biogenesis protein CcmI [Rhodospirillaceae bacterium]